MRGTSVCETPRSAPRAGSLSRRKCFGSAPPHFDPALVATVEGAAQALGVGAVRLATVGHDAAMFHQSGIPASVMLVRNAHGSHNPRESMAEADTGTRVLGGAVMRAAA